jgi:hypothetical protein
MEKLVMNRPTLLLIAMILLLLPSAQAKDWLYYTLDNSQVELTVCDSLVTIRLDSSYGGGKVTPLELTVPGLDPNYEPILQDLDFYQYGVIPGYDLDTLLADLRAHEQVDFATPMFQLTETSIWKVYHELLVCFNDDVSQNEIDALVDEYSLEVVCEPLDW